MWLGFVEPVALMTAGRGLFPCSNLENDARGDGGITVRKGGPPSFHVRGGVSRIKLENRRQASPPRLGFVLRTATRVPRAGRRARLRWRKQRTLNSARTDCPPGSRKVLRVFREPGATTWEFRCGGSRVRVRVLVVRMNFMGRGHATKKVSSRHLLPGSMVQRVRCIGVRWHCDQHSHLRLDGSRGQAPG